MFSGPHVKQARKLDRMSPHQFDAIDNFEFGSKGRAAFGAVPLEQGQTEASLNARNTVLILVW